MSRPPSARRARGRRVRVFTVTFEGGSTRMRRLERTLRRELARRHRWATRADARRDLIRGIEGWFSARRLHSSLDYRSPFAAETNWYRRNRAAAA